MEKINWLTPDKISANTDKTLRIVVRDSEFLNHSTVNNPTLITEHKQQKYLHTTIDRKIQSFGGSTEVFFD